MKVPINSTMDRDINTGAVLIKHDRTAAEASRNARKRVLETESRLQKLELQIENLTSLTEQILNKL